MTTTGDASARSPWAAGALAGLYAVGTGYVALAVLVLLTWAFAPDNADGDPAMALRTAGMAWVLVHFGAIDVASDGVLRMAPLGATLAMGLVVVRSGIWAARAALVRNLREAAAVAGTLAFTYAATGLLVASLASTDATRALPASLAVGAFGTAAVTGSIGVIRGSGLRRALLAQLSASTRTVLSAAAAGVAVMVAGGAALVTLSLLVHGGRVVDLTRDLGADPLGGLTLAVVGIVFVPNLIVWAATFTLGTGFGFGVDTAVAPGGVSVDVLPAFPLLGALPDPGSLPGATYLVLLVPAAAGVVIGLIVNRRARDLVPSNRLWLVAGASVASAAALGLLALLSSGSLGDGRLAEIGPAPVLTTAVAAVVQVLVATLVVWEWPRLQARVDEVRPNLPGLRPMVVDLRDRLGVGPPTDP